MKVHTVVVFRKTWLEFARFEVVHEILARTVAEKPQYVLRQTRVFGDSPKTLRAGEVLHLARFVLTNVSQPCAESEQINVEQVLAMVVGPYQNS
jgi:hypothetical protein